MTVSYTDVGFGFDSRVGQKYEWDFFRIFGKCLGSSAESEIVSKSEIRYMAKGSPSITWWIGLITLMVKNGCQS
uniref:SFRICE_017293 n=1 Tax=Spodoptera frugiperda TaxID=7108 RepID=A0A2H1V1Y5_SPOFR